MFVDEFIDIQLHDVILIQDLNDKEKPGEPALTVDSENTKESGNVHMTEDTDMDEMFGEWTEEEV